MFPNLYLHVSDKTGLIYFRSIDNDGENTIDSISKKWDSKRVTFDYNFISPIRLNDALPYRLQYQ